jgi:hypothetical protein
MYAAPYKPEEVARSKRFAAALFQTDTLAIAVWSTVGGAKNRKDEPGNRPRR